MGSSPTVLHAGDFVRYDIDRLIDAPSSYRRRADQFISADEDWKDYMQKRSLTDPQTRVDLSGNWLVLPTKSARPDAASSVVDLWEAAAGNIFAAEGVPALDRVQ